MANNENTRKRIEDADERDRTEEILAALNGYDGDNLWQDVIEHLPEFDRAATDALGAEQTSDVLALTDGTVLRYREDRRAWIEGGTVDDRLTKIGETVDGSLLYSDRVGGPKGYLIYERGAYRAATGDDINIRVTFHELEDERAAREDFDLAPLPLTYHEVALTPASGGFGMYEEGEASESMDESEILAAIYQSTGEAYELGVDEAPDDVDDIRGRIQQRHYSEAPKRVFAIVTDDHGERHVDYTAIISRCEEAEDDAGEFEVSDSWPQVDGGTRYFVIGPGGEITVDEDENGKLTAFTRPGYRGDEREAIHGAIAAVGAAE